MSLKGFHVTTEIVPEAVYHSVITGKTLENWGKKNLSSFKQIFYFKKEQQENYSPVNKT